MCLYNTLTIQSNTIPVSQVTLNTDNGIIKEEKEGVFTIYPETDDSASIFILRKRGKKNELIDTVIINVQRIPISDFTICDRNKGALSKPCLETQEGIAVFFDLPDVKRYFAILHYVVIIERNGKQIYKKDIAGFNFDEDTRQVFKSLKNGDILKVGDLSIVDCNDRIRNLEKAEFVIVDAY